MPFLNLLKHETKVVGLLVLAGCVSLDDPQPAAPQRPTLSSDTATTAEGTVEIEAGTDVQPDGSLLVPATTKYGAGEATEVFGTWLAWQRIEDASGTESGIGDVLLGIRHRFQEVKGEWPSLGVQAAVKLPVSDTDRGLSTGETDLFLAAMATGSGRPIAWNAYYELGLLGDPDGSGLEVSHLPALAGGVALGSGFSAFGEVAGVFVPARDVDAGFGTLGLAWQPQPQVVFDVGVRSGIGDEAPDILLFAGLTWNLGRPSVSFTDGR